MKFLLFLILLNMYYGAENFQSTEESEYPLLHKCVDLGEAYSAAYLTTREHLLLTNINRNLSRVACEMASTVMLATAKRSKKKQLKSFLENSKVAGIAIQSLDVLDYSVLHLSAYERSLKKFANRLGLDFEKITIDPLIEMGSMLKKRALRSQQRSSWFTNKLTAMTNKIKAKRIPLEFCS